MKKPVIIFVALGGIAACTIVFLNKNKSSAPVVPVVNSAIEKSTSVAPEKNPGPETQTPPTVPAATAPAQVARSASDTDAAKLDDSANPIRKAVDDLLAAKSGKEKHELLQQLVKAGQIDAVIAELKQRATDNPDNPAIPTTLGEAILNKLRDLHDSGKGDYNEIGILAMQADQSFNAALKIDPQNWEANYVKAASMYYWPANPERDADVAQRLSNLIDQQEKAATQQPEFVQTYLTLGNQYQKLNQPEKAVATWQMGLQKFPNDPELLKKINGQ